MVQSVEIDLLHALGDGPQTVSEIAADDRAFGAVHMLLRRGLAALDGDVFRITESGTQYLKAERQSRRSPSG